MSFILGGLLIAVGLFGGGIEVREIKIPPVGQTVRGVSLVVGLAFVGLAVLLSLHLIEKWAVERPESGKDSAGAITKGGTFTFERPMQGDLRLDECYEWGTGCGEKAASAWCKNKGFARAVDYPGENVGDRGLKTRLVGNQVVCDVTYCTSFIRITCER